MKNSKGITLVTLVVTITVILILTSIATYSGMNVINSSKLTAFTTELKIMQTQVNAIYQEDKEQEIGTELTQKSNVAEQAAKVFTANESGITSSEGYRYWSNNEVKKLGIEGVEQDFFVNVKTRSIVSYQGFKYEGETYYTLEQLPNGLYNVKYESTSDKPIFNVSFQCVGSNKWRVTISDIEYNGYIDKWQVAYQLEGNSYWNTTEDLSFMTEKEGIYNIQIQNGNVKSEIVSENIGHKWNEGVCEICKKDVRYLTSDEGEGNWNFSVLNSKYSGFGKVDTSGISDLIGKMGNTINVSCTANFNATTGQAGDHSMGGNVGMIIYNQPIDVTNISKIVMDCWLYSNATTATNYTTIGISNSNDQAESNNLLEYDKYYSFNKSEQVSNYGANGAKKYKLELDLGDYAGYYYLKITTRHEYPNGLYNTSSTAIDKVYPIF